MTHDLFFKILADHLNGKKTDLPEGVDWEKLYNLSHAQQMDAIVYYQCAFPPVPALAQAYSSAVYYFANWKKAIEEVKLSLREAGISCFTVKGLDLAALYPVPALRAMGDCDLAVDPMRMREAMEQMRALGFVPRSEEQKHEWGCERGGLYFELHDELARELEYSNEREASFFNDYMPFVSQGRLDESFHFLYLIYHIKKHIRYSGAGIKQYFDAAVMIRNAKGLRWDWIDEKTAYLGMTKFAGVCYTLIEKWFSVTAPTAFERMDDAFCESITERILKDGAFGYGAEDFQKKRLQSRDAFNRKKGPLWLARGIAFLRGVFPEYKAMRQYPGTTYVDGRVWLLPVAWAHRLIRLCFRRDKSATKNTVRNYFVPKTELEERREFLRRMGID